MTLDEKDVRNFLDQNSKTVIHKIREEKLGEADLKALLDFEQKNKNRPDITGYIKIWLVEDGK